MNEPAENNGGEKNEETYRYDSPVLDYTKDTIETVGVSLPENEEGYRSIVYAGKTCVKRKKDNAIVDERVVTFVILKDSLQYFAVHACEYSFFTEHPELDVAIAMFIFYINDYPSLLFKEQHEPNDRYHRLDKEEIESLKSFADLWYEKNPEPEGETLTHQMIGKILLADILHVASHKELLKNHLEKSLDRVFKMQQGVEEKIVEIGVSDDENSRNLLEAFFMERAINTEVINKLSELLFERLQAVKNDKDIEHLFYDIKKTHVNGWILRSKYEYDHLKSIVEEFNELKSLVISYGSIARIQHARVKNITQRLNQFIAKENLRVIEVRKSYRDMQKDFKRTSMLDKASKNALINNDDSLNTLSTLSKELKNLKREIKQKVPSNIEKDKITPALGLDKLFSKVDAFSHTEQANSYMMGDSILNAWQ